MYFSRFTCPLPWVAMLMPLLETCSILYYSCLNDETDPYIKKIWEMFFEFEVAHLHKACELLNKYENKEWQEVIPNGEFPKLLLLGPNIEYVRNILKNTVNYTAVREEYASVNELPMDFDFFKYQEIVNNNVCCVPSHNVIEQYICKNGIDYRFEVAPNPIIKLQDRMCDNVCVGREPLC